MSEPPTAFTLARRPARARALVAALGLLVLLIGAGRVRFAMTEPLWFDETFTIAIVGQETWGDFLRECWRDPGGPAYYLLARAWSALFGYGDLALRVPSLIAVMIAGALPVLLEVPGLSRRARIAWGLMIYAWWGVGFFLDARCYAVLLAVSTAQLIAFARLLEAPNLKRALAWSALAALAIVTHYYALFFGLAQGLIYLARWRFKAVRTWPAALAFVPAFAEIAWHAPKLKEFSALGRVWHPDLTAGAVLQVATFLVNPIGPLALGGAALILIIARLSGRGAPDLPARAPSGAWLTAGSGLLAFLMVLAFALAGSGLSARYLIPAAPALMLGLVLLAETGPRPTLAVGGLVFLWLALQVSPALDGLGPRRDLPRYEFETASDFLMVRGATDVVFLWDHEVTPIIPADTIARVGGVFFQRAGRPVRVTPLVVTPAQDPNKLIPRMASGPRPGFIWLYNQDGHTAAHRFPPILDKQPGWTCQRTAPGPAGVLACVKD